MTRIETYDLDRLFMSNKNEIVPAIFVRSLQFFASKTAAISNSLTSNKSRSTLFNLSSTSSSGSSSSSSSQRGDNGEDITSAQDIEYWLQRCSICFDAQLDFCLDICRDQFCRECFQRYVKEVVHSSWGLSITKIKCPYVDQNTVDLYNTYNKPYRSFSRCCAECGEEVFAAQVFQICSEEKRKYFKDISNLLRKFLENYGTVKNSKGKNPVNKNDINNFIAKFETDYLIYISGENTDTGVAEMYEYITKKIGKSLGLSLDVTNKRASKLSRRKLKTHTDMVIAAAEISSKIVALEYRPEAWKELQFMHVSNFPQSRCTKCKSDICLQCGDSTHHPGMTCIQYMRHKVENPHLFITNQLLPRIDGNDMMDALENTKWKLANSKSCPNCSILINRDDGCNKVDCLHCGYRFCWICRNGWSEKCGFYQCRIGKQKKVGDKQSLNNLLQQQNTLQLQNQQQSDDVSQIDGFQDDDVEIDVVTLNVLARSLDDQPEIGVPNVFLIQSKIAPTTTNY
ncbi:17536_t:CDS:2 [Funneliformis caledonium]|uniref:17536_t:CDS:1 n=1 Tax=Funneliformis caledonium TaxID=1117310 RepID=A0A9N8YKZ8_9GLOM|nr:17536_t:CDS:2 [Funneliformis caledonium]